MHNQQYNVLRLDFEKVHDKGGIVSFMKNRILLLGVIVLLGLCIPVLAANVDGKWQSERAGRQGGAPTITTYEFKANGAELTGKLISTGRDGTPTETPITEGKIAGDTITFTVVRSMGGNEMKQKYTGKVAGDEITFTMEMEGGMGGGMGAPPGGGAGGPGGGAGGPGGGMGAPPAGGAGGPGGGMGGGMGGPREIIAKRVK
jgi:hypothetical protein